MGSKIRENEAKKTYGWVPVWDTISNRQNTRDRSCFVNVIKGLIYFLCGGTEIAIGKREIVK